MEVVCVVFGKERVEVEGSMSNGEFDREEQEKGG